MGFGRPSLAFAALLLCAPSLDAQIVRGQVVDGLTGVPVGAGFIVLVDVDGTELDRSLTTASGRFTLSVPPKHRGPLRLRSERIGFAVTVSDAFDASPAGDLEFTLRVGALPTPLATIEVRARSECENRMRADAPTGIVWEEVRKALAATSWANTGRRLRFTSNVYERVFDDRRRTVLDERFRPSIGFSSAPFISQEPSRLVEDGYVIAHEDAYVYFAPDAEALQDERFLETHCFRLERSGRGGDELIGLAFEPVPSRDLPDVQGVLWIDRVTSELRSLEYRYTNLPYDLRINDVAEGTVEFTRLPSGAWIVHRWRITVPTVRVEPVSPFDRETRRFRMVVDGFRDVGGEVLSATDAGGVRVYQAELAEVIGVVVDSSEGERIPLSGAVVQIVGTWFADTTDVYGRFRIGAPLEGPYGVTFAHRRSDSLGFVPRVHSLLLARGRADTLALVVPPMRQILMSVCPRDGAGSYGRALVGTVRDTGGSPVRDAQVVASWQRIRRNLDFENMEVVDRTDAGGSYAICGLEPTRPAMVYVVSSSGRSDVVRVAFEPGGVAVGSQFYPSNAPIWRRDWQLRPHSDVATLLSGLVTDATTGQPVAGAAVTIGRSTGTAETDSTGMFALEGLQAGDHRLTVRRAGYGVRSGGVTVHADQPSLIRPEFLALTPAAQVDGTIVDQGTDDPLAGAWVTLLSDAGDSLAMTRSDSSGAFTLTAPGPGSYYLTARRIGYTPGVQGPLQLSPGRPATVPFPLERNAFELDPLTVTAESGAALLQSVGFYRRQREGMGFFLDRAAIEERLPVSHETTELLRGIPGVRILPPQSVGDEITREGGDPRYDGQRVRFVTGLSSFQTCGEPRTFVDGHLISGSINEFVNPQHVEAVEVYRRPAEVPAEYSGAESACGVILFWTRRRQ